MAKGSKTQETSLTKTDPYKPAQPLLGTVLGQAEKLGGDPSNFKAIFGGDTQAAVNMLRERSMAPSLGFGAMSNVVQGSGQGYGTGLDTLIQTARGDMVGANPNFEAALANMSDKTANTVNQQFSAAGRYGSGAHTGTLADRIGKLQTSARADQYNTDAQRQLEASNQLTGQGFQGASLAPQADQASLFNANLRAQVGTQEDLMSNSSRMAPMQAVDWQRSNAVPIAGLGGVTDSNKTTFTPANTAGMIAGAGMAGLGLATGNPMMVMGGLGGMGGTNMMGGGGGQAQAPMYGSGKPFFGALN